MPQKFSRYLASDWIQRILRKTFWEAVEQRESTYNLAHVEHCFDALRQVWKTFNFLREVYPSSVG